MRFPFRQALVACAVIGLLVTTLLVIDTGNPRSHTRDADATPTTATATTSTPQAPWPAALLTPVASDISGFATMAITRYVAYVEGVERAQYAYAVLLVQAQDEAAAAAARAAYTPPPTPAPNYQPGPVSSGNVGDCTGFSVPDYIIQRESGGDPNAVNPSSGAYGCSQTLPSHYQPGGACAGLNMYTVDGQRQCTYILSDGGTNLQPWAL